MVTEFVDQNGASAHDEFQAWRTEHQGHVFLTMATRTKANLHAVRCSHMGSGPPYFTSQDRYGLLTVKRKVCGTEEEVLRWAVEHQITVERCRTCVRNGILGSTPPELQFAGDVSDISGVATSAPDRSQGDQEPDEEFSEGGEQSVLATRYERNPAARNACLKYYGRICRACNVGMDHLYGTLGEGHIHVHHRVPLSEIGAAYKVDPVRDLIPVCPNCHAILHRSRTPMTVEQLAKIIRERLGKAA